MFFFIFLDINSDILSSECSIFSNEILPRFLRLMLWINFYHGQDLNQAFWNVPLEKVGKPTLLSLFRDPIFCLLFGSFDSKQKFLERRQFISCVTHCDIEQRLEKRTKIASPRRSRVETIFYALSTVVQWHYTFLGGFRVDLDFRPYFGWLKWARNPQKGKMSNDKQTKARY